VEGMTLSSLVVSRDWQEISVLECILGGLHIDVDVIPDPDRAWNKLTRSKVDALIVDRDLAGTDRFLRKVEVTAPTTNAVPLVILSAVRSVDCRVDANTLFRFEKPISVEQAVRTLSAARNLILNGRLRYHRQAIQTPVTLSAGPKKKVQAHLLNLSQGGIGIRAERRFEIDGPVQITFSLPGSDRAVKASGRVAWSDQTGHAGLKFVQVGQKLQKDLETWLAQRYFTE
jgi:Tfp pilus assembly protein PilZ